MACKILPPQTIKGQWDSNRLSAYRASWKSLKKNSAKEQPRGAATSWRNWKSLSTKTELQKCMTECDVRDYCDKWLCQFDEKVGFLLGNSLSCKTEVSHSTLQKPTSNKMWGVVWEGGCRKAGGERVRTATAAARQDRRWPTPGANQTTCTFRKNYSFSMNSDVFWRSV